MSLLLTVSGAYKNYGSTKALDGAAMSLKRGECLALLGPNGAGKTTLIRFLILSRLFARRWETI